VIRHVGGILSAAARATPRLDAGELCGRLIAYGVASLPIVGIASLCVGMVMGLHTVLEFARFGVQGLTARVVAVSVLRELGPIFTALLVAGRAGAGMASELGALAESGQITAMRGLGIDLDREILAPRILAVVIATAVLTAYADLLGVVGGLVVSTGASGVSAAGYLARTVDALSGLDLFLSGAKAIVFGLTVGLSGAYFGLREKAGPADVGRDTMRAVVWASFLVLFLNLTVTRLVVAVAG